VLVLVLKKQYLGPARPIFMIVLVILVASRIGFEIKKRKENLLGMFGYICPEAMHRILQPIYNIVCGCKWKI
jgi:hypothetical protein